MDTHPLTSLLESLDADAKRRGDQFEAICCWFLLNDPIYRAQLKKVWLWKKWPKRWGPDAGIDIVAQGNDGQMWAIQCKAYSPSYSVKKADVDSFLSESNREVFSYRLLMATTDKIGGTAQKVMRAQEKPVGQLLLSDLRAAEVCWPTTSSDLVSSPIQSKTRLPHQRFAIKDVLSKFREGYDRGQLIMACGTGKTLASLWIHEDLESKRTLVLVPSLSLLKQTISEWLANAAEPFEFLPVCSDETVADKDAVVAHVADLGFPVTSSAAEVASFLRRRTPRVVFSTYQSSAIVAEALQDAPCLDLVLADEAHRCAGKVSSVFAHVLDGMQIRAKKRLYMTATPRHYTGRAKKIANHHDHELASMDDVELFGPVFHRLSFSHAIDRGLLSNYRVFVIGVDEERYKNEVESGTIVTHDGETITDARTLAAQIGLVRAICEYDLRRILTFHSRVKTAQQFAQSLPAVVNWMPSEDRPIGRVWAEHVSGSMSASDRNVRLDQLRQVGSQERGVISNARCLSEGVDVPSLDGVAFIDPKRSAVDITQAVGRAIRKSVGKKSGTIVIPVFVDSSQGAVDALEDSSFDTVWSVLRALREHDDTIAEKLDLLRVEIGKSDTTKIGLPDSLIIKLPRRVGKAFAQAFRVRLVEETSDSWHQWFGLL